MNVSDELPPFYHRSMNDIVFHNPSFYYLTQYNYNDRKLIKFLDGVQYLRGTYRHELINGLKTVTTLSMIWKFDYFKCEFIYIETETDDNVTYEFKFNSRHPSHLPIHALNYWDLLDFQEEMEFIVNWCFFELDERYTEDDEEIFYGVDFRQGLDEDD
jgi:hypothetical protein